MLGYVTDSATPGGLVRRHLSEPEAGPHDAVIEVRAYAVNRGELQLLQQRTDGWTPGQDGAGVVAAAADDGSGPPVGTRVVFLANWGSWSERVAVPTHRVAPIPDDVSCAQAAALPVAGLTALRALRSGGSVLGRRVLITGASGGVGHFAAQLAHAAGARVTALVSGPHRIDAVRELGINSVVTEVIGGPFDLVVDGVGGQVLVEAVHAVAPGGTVTAYGMASGQPSTLSFVDFGRGPLARLVGFFLYATGEQTFGEDLGFLAGLVSDGHLRVEASISWDWSRTAEAVEVLRQRQVTGKVVLAVG